MYLQKNEDTITASNNFTIILSDHVAQNIYIKQINHQFTTKQKEIIKYDWVKINEDIDRIDLRTIYNEKTATKTNKLMNILDEIEFNNKSTKIVFIDYKTKTILPVKINKLICKFNILKDNCKNYQLIKEIRLQISQYIDESIKKI